MKKFFAIAIIAIGLFTIGYWAGSNTTVECGGCGAYIHRWWTIDNIHTGKPVKVCEVCYQAAISQLLTAAIGL